MATTTTQTSEATPENEITQGLPVGAGAVLRDGVRSLMRADTESVNALGEAVTTEDHSYTITDNNTGASVTVEADRATVGPATEQAVWSNISAPQALRMVYSMAGIMAPHMESALDEMLNAVADGASWDDAYEQVTGHALSDERREASDERVANTRRSVVQTRNGRQQATGVTVSN